MSLHKAAQSMTDSGVLQPTTVYPDINVAQPYRLYKRRFAGLFGLFVLSLSSSMMWPWFGPIANSTSADFDITLDQVNWLGNVVSCVYIPLIVLAPWVISKYGVQRCCQIAAAALLVSAWMRYASTVSSLSGPRAYALLIISQFVGAIAQGIYQVLAPKYSELWFNLNGRTTATMLLSIANPIGSAVGQLLSPSVGSTRHSILVLAIISSATVPCNFLIGEKPPTPPTHAAAQKPRPLSSLSLDMIGKGKTTGEDEATSMTVRERLDFLIVCLLFGMILAATSAFSILSSQYLSPYGYSNDIAGLMGATLILSGIVSAGISAPLFDRVFTNHLALTVKILVPILVVCWLSVIWAARPDNAGALFVIFAIIGVCSVALLPVGLELGVELTRAAEASSAILWGVGNIFTVMFVLAQSALRGGPTSSPPFNMHNAFILQAVLLCAVTLLVIPLKGEQKRRKRDELDLANHHDNMIPVDRNGSNDEEGFPGGSGTVIDHSTKERSGFVDADTLQGVS